MNEKKEQQAEKIGGSANATHKYKESKPSLWHRFITWLKNLFRI